MHLYDCLCSSVIRQVVQCRLLLGITTNIRECTAATPVAIFERAWLRVHVQTRIIYALACTLLVEYCCSNALDTSGACMLT